MISNRTKSKVIGMTTLIGTISLASACSVGESDNGEGSSETLELAFANYTDASSLFGPVGAGFEDAANNAGYEVSRYDNKADAQTTLDNAQLMVQNDPDVIVEYSPDPGLGEALYAQFDGADISCIALNIPTDGCPLLNVVNANGGIDAGIAAADFAEENGWNGDNTTVLLAGNPAAGEDVNDTIRYFYTSFAEEADGFSEIAPEEFTADTTRISDNAIHVDGGGSLDGAFDAVQAALQNIPSDQNIILSANNDDASLGGWRAIEEAGRSDTSAVIGFGGSSAALEQLRDNPQWIIEVDSLLSVWGYYAVAMATAVADGAETPELTELPYLILTEENIGEFYDTDDFSRPTALPEPLPSNEYLHGYGILEDY